MSGVNLNNLRRLVVKIGSSLLVVAASDPRISADVSFINCFSGFFDGRAKLGIGSSAAALTAWAAAWSVYSGQGHISRDEGGLETLIGLHRTLQGGSGSGLDVAASLFGGILTYRLVSESGPRVGSVQLPNSVGFTTVFTGFSASTRDLVAAYSDWRTARPAEAARIEISTASPSPRKNIPPKEAAVRSIEKIHSCFFPKRRDSGSQIGTKPIDATM